MAQPNQEFPGVTPPPPLPREQPTYSSSSTILTFTSHIEENAGIDPHYSPLILKIFLFSNKILVPFFRFSSSEKQKNFTNAKFWSPILLQKFR